ncbi:EAL domain-containing protein [Paenibacillus athensensis]|uniref:Diguanylate cyclase n=1 Tax=Paenibacillus athensensis TaxID=1967502 RepID=A0A4Y8PRY8_9BACL|nr:EAL domain-containing protein [Paenibacillus athensensis]MCD1260474.1 EAL domain-containing protein [Paenibacillus athensensis]
MSKPYRIGVMAPYLDGEYFGKIVETVHTVIQEHGAQMFALQTVIEHRLDYTMTYPVAMDHVDAWILILECATKEVLQVLGQTGKPVISLGYHLESIPCHSVMIDNYGGMKSAVLHLIDHGHREIAFIGWLGQYELRERFAGYRDALTERGLPLREELIVELTDNGIEGGEWAARELLKRRVAFTALAAGTDMNAIGFMDAVEAQGWRLPGDLAVVGFDDMDQAATHSIPLTTVRQSFPELSRTAMELLFRMLDGHVHANSLIRLPAELIVRASCGCDHAPDLFPQEDYSSLKKKLLEHQASLNRMSINNYMLVQGLVQATSGEKIDFANLFWNECHWGCLALWEDDEDGGGRHLIIHQTFSQHQDPTPPIGARCRLESFPPIDYLPASTLDGGADHIILHPVISEEHEWGFLALVGPKNRLNRLFSGDIARHSYTILSAALERESLFNRIRTIAEQLEIVSRTTNDGIWDWDLVSNKVEWNSRVRSIFGDLPIPDTSNPNVLLSMIHEDDYPLFVQALEAHYKSNVPFHIELRFLVADGQIKWLFLAGDAVRDDSGKPIRMIGSVTDITAKKEDEQKITQLAYHDALTGLPNRLLFHKRLDLCMSQSNRYKFKLAVLLIDLDRFKNINDTLGHQAGDKLLQHVAQKLNISVRECDTIARLGGDEFIILLTHLHDLREMSKITERILTNLNAPFLLEDQEIRISGSIGVSLYPDHATNADSLIKYADIAMYTAKENGRGQVEIYTPDLSSKALQRFELENSLRKAIERGEFSLHYQPQIDLRTGRFFGIEALIRWHSPDKGMIPPMDFIPLAEEMGLIVPIGTWVLRQACLQVKEWLGSGLPPMIISVNISAQQFHMDNFVQMVKEVLAETGVAPAHLCLEITETTAIRNIERSVQMLSELVEMGIHIAIDDFGTGYSSLGVLKRLPVHTVKIDKSFIRDMTEDDENAAIVKAIIAMSHSLGLSVTAEGVEIHQQLDNLRSLDCDFIQGYYIGKPMPSEQFTSFYHQYLAEPLADGEASAAEA